MTTRAVSLELAPDVSTKCFANTFLRHISRRGKPSLVLSDQGSNLKSFSKELATMAKSNKVNNILLANGIEWSFNPVNAPNRGGSWERNLGTCKSIIKKSVGKRLLTFD